MDELNRIREPRIIVWCSYNGWTNLKFVVDHFEAIPPNKTEYEKIPSIAYKPPFPGNFKQGS